MAKKNKANPWLIPGALLLAGGAYWFISEQQKDDEAVATAPAPTPTAQAQQEFAAWQDAAVAAQGISRDAAGAIIGGLMNLFRKDPERAAPRRSRRDERQAGRTLSEDPLAKAGV